MKMYCHETNTCDSTVRTQTIRPCRDIKLNITSRHTGKKEHVYVHLPEPERIWYMATVTQPQTLTTTNPTRIIFDNPIFYSDNVTTCCDDSFVVPKCGDGLYTISFAVSYDPGSTVTVTVELKVFSTSGTAVVIRVVLTPTQPSEERTITIPLVAGSKVFLQATTSAAGTVTLNPTTGNTNYFNISRVE